MKTSPVFGALNFCSGFLLAVAGVSLTLPAAHAQTIASAPSKLLEWDVVSIKVSKPGNDEAVSNATGANGYSVTIPLKQLISDAYEIREDLISGLPKWAGSAQFDIEAKVADTDADVYHKLLQKQKDMMLQPILADRFKLTAHTETKQLPVYELVVAKAGKLQSAQPGAPDAGGFSTGAGQITCQTCDVSFLSGMLARSLQRTVIDKTGLAGKYDIKLRWSDYSGPSLFTALEEQLGLKLQHAKGPVETLIVDHVEMPSEN
jgi:uncharacterized protein (TIGR03435 family)